VYKSRTILAVLIISILSVGTSAAADFTHTAYVDTALPTNVTGQCASTWNGPGVWTYTFICRLMKQGTEVDFELLGDLRAYGNSGNFTAYLSAPRINNCVYCTRNYGLFMDSFIPSNILSEADGDGTDKECDTTGSGPGGGGSGGEP
jgi:hypothetical protein